MDPMRYPRMATIGRLKDDDRSRVILSKYIADILIEKVLIVYPVTNAAAECRSKFTAGTD